CSRAAMACLPPSMAAVIPPDNASICDFSVAGSIGGLGQSSLSLNTPSWTAFARVRTSVAVDLLKLIDALIDCFFPIFSFFLLARPAIEFPDRHVPLGMGCAIRSGRCQPLGMSELEKSPRWKRAPESTYRLTCTTYRLWSLCRKDGALLFGKRRCYPANGFAV